MKIKIIYIFKVSNWVALPMLDLSECYDVVSSDEDCVDVSRRKSKDGCAPRPPRLGINGVCEDYL